MCNPLNVIGDDENGSRHVALHNYLSSAGSALSLKVRTTFDNALFSDYIVHIFEQ